MRAWLPYPLDDAYLLQAGGDDGDAVVVYAGLLPLYSLGGVVVGVELQDAAEVPGGWLHVAVHHGGGPWLGRTWRLAEEVVHHAHVGLHLVFAVVNVYGRVHVS